MFPRIAPPIAFTLPLAIALVLAIAPSPAAAQLSPVVVTGPAGSGLFGKTVRALPNGNFVVADPGYDVGAALDVGAVHLYDGNNQTRIATLTGTTAGDQVGLEGADPGIIVLPNGNYLVRSQNWDNGAIVNAGAVTYCNSVGSCDGSVSAANSLVGSTTSDFVGTSVKVLSTGNYVVINQVWDNPLGGIVNVGAVSFCQGGSGCSGPVSGTNSLIGVRTEDRVGVFLPLSNGNYVIGTRNWDNASPSLRADAGAASWCSGTSGCIGPVTSANSLVGTTAGDRVGDLVSALSDGSYVVGSGLWDKSSPGLIDAGAATWCNAAGACNGQVVTAANSLTGASANDQVGGSLNATPLPGGAYVVSTQNFDNVAGGGSDVGAVTWCASGGVGCTGVVVGPTNSLVGARLGDLFGPQIVALKNGNFAVGALQWDEPTTPLANVGAVAFCSAATHCANQILGPSNALVGSAFIDNVGSSVIGLANGNYVVRSPAWDNGATADVGAVTFCDGAVGCIGPVTVGNSFTGSSASDQVGGSVVALSNGNYVVDSPSWNSGLTLDVGAVRLCDGNAGCFGIPGLGNSLIGLTPSDLVGSGGVTALPNGSYVVSSRVWDNGAVANAGASTWCSGTSGCTGVISPGNSLVGSTNGDQISNPGIDALPGDKYLVRSMLFDDGATVNAMAYTLGSALGGTFGPVSSANSIVGAVTDGITAYDYDAARDRLYVGRAPSNAVSILGVPEPGVGAVFAGVVGLLALARRRSKATGHGQRLA